MKQKRSRKRAKHLRRAAIWACVLVMLLSLGYLVHWEIARREIENKNARLSELYPAAPTDTAAPTSTPSPSPSVEPSATQMPTPSATAVPTPVPTPTQAITPSATTAQTPMPTATNTQKPRATQSVSAKPTAAQSNAPTAKPTALPTATQAPSPTPSASLPMVQDATLAPLGTPDAETLIFAIETPPPAQLSFDDLCFLNPETVAFLQIDDQLRLPVVQRKNDNSYYLDHDFEGEESIAGTLFLDGANLLVPEDDVLLVYGHNMRNGTMFHMLSKYEEPSFLKEHPFVRFDTLYTNRTYVPFAMLSVSAEENSPYYLNLRRFEMDEAQFLELIGEIQKRSVLQIPLDVQYGDSLLLLVTCEYVHDNGRFVVALRAIREDETQQALRAQLERAWKK